MARYFDGSDHLKLDSYTSPGYPFSIACWFRADTTTLGFTLAGLDNTSGINFCIVNAQGNVSGDPVRVTCRDPSSGLVPAATTSGYTANTWYHAVGVFDSTSSRSVYINGDDKGSETSTTADPTINALRIGALKFNGADSNEMQGRIAEVGFWDRALTDGEAATLAAGFSPLFVPGLIHYWPFGGALTADDEKRDLISGQTLTAVGNEATADHVPGMIYPAPPFAIEYAAGTPPAGGRVPYEYLYHLAGGAISV